MRSGIERTMHYTRHHGPQLFFTTHDNSHKKDSRRKHHQLTYKLLFIATIPSAAAQQH